MKHFNVRCDQLGLITEKNILKMLTIDGTIYKRTWTHFIIDELFELNQYWTDLSWTMRLCFILVLLYRRIEFWDMYNVAKNVKFILMLCFVHSLKDPERHASRFHENMLFSTFKIKRNVSWAAN